MVSAGDCSSVDLMNLEALCLRRSLITVSSITLEVAGVAGEVIALIPIGEGVRRGGLGEGTGGS